MRGLPPSIFTFQRRRHTQADTQTRTRTTGTHAPHANTHTGTHTHTTRKIHRLLRFKDVLENTEENESEMPQIEAQGDQSQ
jgi:hypothetical protein